MIAIVDYGVGNLRSVENAFTHIGESVCTTSDPEILLQADGVVLPGVGAFGDAMQQLKIRNLIHPIKQYAKDGRPLLGICLGMQMLFEMSEEHGEHVGLGLLSGHVTKMQGHYKIPHVGWNQLQMKQEHAVGKGVSTGDYVYFVHSYYVVPSNPQVVLASTDYHQAIPAIVVQNRIFGMQFHPERSSTTGLQLLKNFAQYSATLDRR